MHRKHRVYYIVSSRDNYWYQKGKWLHSIDIDYKKDYSSYHIFYTRTRAELSALSCKAEMYVEKHVCKRGRRQCKWILHLPSEFTS